MKDGKVTLERLMNGEKLMCPKCNKAIIVPFGTIADKAHSFICPNCNFEAHYTPYINID